MYSRFKIPGKKDEESTVTRSKTALAGGGSRIYSHNTSSKVSVRASHAFLGKIPKPEINITVLDDQGNDVTPQSLLGGSKMAAKLPGLSSLATNESSLMTSMTKVCFHIVMNLKGL